MPTDALKRLSSGAVVLLSLAGLVDVGLLNEDVRLGDAQRRLHGFVIVAATSGQRCVRACAFCDLVNSMI